MIGKKEIRVLYQYAADVKDPADIADILDYEQHEVEEILHRLRKKGFIREGKVTKTGLEMLKKHEKMIFV